MIEELATTLVNFSDSELDEFIRTQELARRHAEARLAVAVASADARQIYDADGHRSMKGYLRATCNYSNAEVARVRSAARLVNHHGRVGDSWLSGRIGSAQVNELAKVRSHRAVTDRFREFVPKLVEHAEALPFNDFASVIQRLIALADADGRMDERDSVERRSATVVAAAGELHVSMSGGDASSAAEFEAVVQRFAQVEFDKDLAAQNADGETRPLRTGPQRRFDALVHMARAAASHEGVISTSEPLVSVLVDQHTMSWVLAHSGLGAANSLDGTSIDPFTGLPVARDAFGDLLGEPDDLLRRRCETSTGVPLRPSDVLRAVLSGHIRRVVLGAKGRIVDMGRSQRVFTGPARDAAMLLTTTCEHPGCALPAEWCQVDHVTEWHQRGATDQDNAAIACGHHNRDKHRRRRRSRRTADGRIQAIRSDGTLVLPVGQSPPDPDDIDDIDDWYDDLELSAEEDRTVTDAIRARAALLVAAR